jgi:hypothetical protein
LFSRYFDQSNAAVIRLSHETGTWDYHRERKQSHRYPEWRLSIRCVDQRYDQGENREYHADGHGSYTIMDWPAQTSMSP